MRVAKKKILHLLAMRRKAGEALMRYDYELECELLKYGIDINGIEFGSNSVFLMTEPRVCEQQMYDFIEAHLGDTLKE